MNPLARLSTKSAKISTPCGITLHPATRSAQMASLPMAPRMRRQRSTRQTGVVQRIHGLPVPEHPTQAGLDRARAEAGRTKRNAE